MLRKSDSVQNILHGSMLTVMDSSPDLRSSSQLSKSCISLPTGFKSRIPTPTTKVRRPPVPPKPANLMSGRKKTIVKRETSSPPSLESSTTLPSSGRSTPSLSLSGRRPSKIPLWKGSQESLSSVSSLPCPRPKKWESCVNLEMYRSPSVEKKRSLTPKPKNLNIDLNAKSRQMTESLKKLQAFQKRDRQTERIQTDKKTIEETELLEASYMQILRENTDLQRSYQLLLSSGKSPDSDDPEPSRLREELSAAEKVIEELESSLASSSKNLGTSAIKDRGLLIRQNYSMSEKLKSLQEKEAKMKSELRDAKDQSELLEFRVLELEEENGRYQLKKMNPTKTVETRDAGIETDGVCCDSGNSSVTSDEEIIELYNDFRKEKVSSTKTRLQELVHQTPRANDKSLLLQTVALFESLLNKIQTLQKDNEELKELRSSFDDIVFELEDSRQKLNNSNEKVEILSKENASLSRELSEMSSAKANADSVILHLEEKYALANSRIAELEKRLEMNEEMNVAEEEDEDSHHHHLCFTKVQLHRREKMGGCSSSSGISSDVSDSENDHHRGKSVSPESNRKEIFTESGIFVEEERQHAATQTLEDIRSIAEEDGRSDYESSEELEDLKEECRDLVERKKELEFELERFKEEIKTLKTRENDEFQSDQRIMQLERIEYSLRNQLSEWEKKYKSLHQQNEDLLEEKCELEEADNDSRLNAQRWEHDYKMSFEKSLRLSDELALERKAMSRMKTELDELQRSAEESRNESAYLEALVQRYEQRIFDLEELEVELREKLTLLEQAFNVLSWWTRVSMSFGTRLSSTPMILHLPSERGEDTEKENDALACKTESCLKVRELAERLYLGQEENAMRIKELDDSLRSSETSLRSNALELERLREKELAYEETMVRAESILRDVELNYRNKISILEDEKRSLKNKLHLSEQRSLETRLALSDEIEADLKDRIMRLEETEHELNIRLSEQRRLNSDLRKEMLEREEDLSMRLSDLKSENERISSTLRRKMTDIENESDDTRRRLSETERESEERFQKIRRLENEISRLLLPRSDDHHPDNTLRIRVRGFEKSTPSLCSRDSALDSSEEYSYYRSELSELQNDLASSNKRLNESDAAVDRLKEEIRDIKEQLQILKRSIRSRRESPPRRNECPPSIDQGSDHVWAGEGGLVAITRDVESAVRIIEKCRNCEGGISKLLKDSATSLRNMSSIICGEQRLSLDEGLLRSESEETISGEPRFEEMKKRSSEEGILNANLQSQLGELRDKLIQMEEELNLVGNESRELQVQLTTSRCNAELKDKELQLRELHIKELESENVRLLDNLNKQKNKAESFNSRFREMLANKRQYEYKCEVKDFLIKTLAEYSASLGNRRPSTLIDRLKETTFKPSYKGMDFNLDSLCHYLETFRGREKSEHHLNLDETQSFVDETLFVSQNIHIVSQIDSNTLLISWTPPPKDIRVKAYLVYVSGNFHQKITEFWLGKALIHGLNLETSFLMDFVSIGIENNRNYSKYVSIQYHPTESSN